MIDNWRDSKKFYKSGKLPEYPRGRVVYLWRTDKLNCTGKRAGYTRHFCHPFTVEEVSKKKSGLIFKEFTYTLVNAYDKNDIVRGVYESTIEKTQKEEYYEPPMIAYA